MGGHTGEGLCLCTVDEDGDLAEDQDGWPIIHPECPVPGHSRSVTRVEFSDDGAQVRLTVGVVRLKVAWSG